MLFVFFSFSSESRRAMLLLGRASTSRQACCNEKATEPFRDMHIPMTMLTHRLAIDGALLLTFYLRLIAFCRRRFFPTSTTTMRRFKRRSFVATKNIRGKKSFSRRRDSWCLHRSGGRAPISIFARENLSFLSCMLTHASLFSSPRRCAEKCSDEKKQKQTRAISFGEFIIFLFFLANVIAFSGTTLVNMSAVETTHAGGSAKPTNTAHSRRRELWKTKQQTKLASARISGLSCTETNDSGRKWIIRDFKAFCRSFIDVVGSVGE